MCINGPSGKSFILARPEWILHYFFIYSVLCTTVGGVQDYEISDCNGKHLFSHSFYVMGHRNTAFQSSFSMESRESSFQTTSFSLKKCIFVSLFLRDEKNETKHMLLRLKSLKQAIPAQLHLNVLGNRSWTTTSLCIWFLVSACCDGIVLYSKRS